MPTDDERARALLDRISVTTSYDASLDALRAYRAEVRREAFEEGASSERVTPAMQRSAKNELEAIKQRLGHVSNGEMCGLTRDLGDPQLAQDVLSLIQRVEIAYDLDGSDDLTAPAPEARPEPTVYRAGTVPPRVEVGMVLCDPADGTEYEVAHLAPRRVEVQLVHGGCVYGASRDEASTWPLARDFEAPGDEADEDLTAALREMNPVTIPPALVRQEPVWCWRMPEADEYRPGLHATRELAIEDAREWAVPGTVYVGRIAPYSASGYLGDIVECLMNEADGSGHMPDSCDTWPDVTDEAAKELQGAVERIVDQWATKYGAHPQFGEVVDEEEVDLQTALDRVAEEVSRGE